MLNSTPPLSGTTSEAQTRRQAGIGSEHDIRRAVERTLDGSLEYQILRKTLIKEQAGQPASDKPKAEIGEPSQAQQASYGSESPPVTTISDAEVAAGLRVAGERMRQQTAAVEVRELRVEAGAEPVQKSDPLLLDLDGDGIETSGLQAGLAFDIDADGDTDQTSFASDGDAFLALDRNGNGRIDDGSELFGDQHGHANGFAALAEYDNNQDGVIDARDNIFERLQLVSAVQGRMETRSLGAYGVAAIQLGYTTTNQRLNPWDSVVQAGSFRFEDGRVGQAVDVMLGHRER